MTMVSGTNNIVFENGVIFTESNSKDKTNLWNKLIRMGFDRNYNVSSDENAGLAQAGKLGQNPFDYTIISK
jgi:hypothetical protein